MKAEQKICPECRELKPKDPTDLHDVVLLRMDWRKAERERIDQKIGESVMCHACARRIMEQFSPLAPTFDKRGNRIREERA